MDIDVLLIPATCIRTKKREGGAASSKSPTVRRFLTIGQQQQESRRATLRGRRPHPDGLHPRHTYQLQLQLTALAQSPLHPRRPRVQRPHLLRRETAPVVRAIVFTSSPAAHEKRGVDFYHLDRVDLQKPRRSADLFLDNAQTGY